jgi:dihydrofolate synthase / folylpolyglutamate synthase
VNFDSRKRSGPLVGTPRCPESFRGTSQRDVPTIPSREIFYKEALAWLYSLQRFGIKLGLENIRRLIAELHIDLSRARVIHVAGTNGKGSACAMIDSICRAQKYRTGLFTSPHLITFRERIRVNGQMISENAVASGLTSIRNLTADWDPQPTFFEITTGLALQYFTDERLDVIILETGLGGRLDATNAVQSNVSVITSIDLDHEKWLGDSLQKIAAEKAGIIKSKVPVVSAPQKKEVELVLRNHAADCESPIEFITEPHELHPIALCGAYQKQNAALAIAALRAAKSASRTDSSRGEIDIDDSAIAHGLASVDWPARFQKWDERTIIDGAHNPSAAHILANTWRESFGNQRATLILAILSDKDFRRICEALLPITDSILLPKIRSERAADPKQLANVISSFVPSLPYSITPSIAEAIEVARSRPHPILLTGSLHFAGEALAHLRGEPAAFEECAQ